MAMARSTPKKFAKLRKRCASGCNSSAGKGALVIAVAPLAPTSVNVVAGGTKTVINRFR
jgi:hypothetical protein